MAQNSVLPIESEKEPRVLKGSFFVPRVRSRASQPHTQPQTARMGSREREKREKRERGMEGGRSLVKELYPLTVSAIVSSKRRRSKSTGSPSTRQRVRQSRPLATPKSDTDSEEEEKRKQKKRKKRKRRQRRTGDRLPALHCHDPLGPPAPVDLRTRAASPFPPPIQSIHRPTALVLACGLMISVLTLQRHISPSLSQ
ncbi:unnamed protein product [Pleuronectes platessa]|uniref:Uncharacterized protein n=1 Tax=Pleuronectes platessa TaxID=8262 RepID=A0A9N7YPX8_PLEPL|nr:unnamed protein product [Pleuronectes platessa]